MSHATKKPEAIADLETAVDALANFALVAANEMEALSDRLILVPLEHRRNLNADLPNFLTIHTAAAAADFKEKFYAVLAADDSKSSAQAE